MRMIFGACSCPDHILQPIAGVGILEEALMARSPLVAKALADEVQERYMPLRLVEERSSEVLAEAAEMTGTPEARPVELEAVGTSSAAILEKQQQIDLMLQQAGKMLEEHSLMVEPA
jgi:hypothetical protein